MVRFRSPAPQTSPTALFVGQKDGVPAKYHSEARTLCGVKFGRIPEWPKGADCKSVVDDFGGSNPPPPTNKNLNRTIRLRFLFVRGTVDEPCALNSAIGVMYRSRSLNFCVHFLNARRFGGTLCVTPSPFPTARNETQRPPNTPLCNALHLWRTSTS